MNNFVSKLFKIYSIDFIKPICLPRNGEKSLPGKQISITGWGLTEFAGITLNINSYNSSFKTKIYQIQR